MVPALRDAGWPSFLAVVGAFGLAACALQPGHTWLGLLLSPLGILSSFTRGMPWGFKGLRDRSGGARGNLAPVLRAMAVTALLLVF